MAEEYEIIAAQLLRVNSKNHRAWCDWGVGLFQKALTLPDDLAIPLFADAARKFAVATDLSPSTALYWRNWGAAMLHQAKREPTEGFRSLFQEASQYYERAMRLSPRSPEIWHYRGGCYFEWAKKTAKEENAALFETAYVSYAVAAELLAPHLSSVWEEWGIALLYQAGQSDSSLAPWLTIESIAKYERALQFNPDTLNSLNNCAIAYRNLTDYLPVSPACTGWLEKAITHLSRAILLVPDNARYWINRGVVLHTQARFASRREKREIYDKADADCTIAYSLDSEFPQTLASWGQICLSRSQIAKTDAEAIILLQEADTKFQTALEKNPDIAGNWVNWGIVYLNWAFEGEPEDAIARLTEACEKFIVARRLAPDNFEAFVFWSSVLTSLARRSSQETAESYLKEAEEKAQEAIRLNPNSFLAWMALGDVTTARAFLETDEDRRETFLQESDVTYQKVNAIAPNKGTYGLACVAALRGSTEDCRSLLEEALEKEASLFPRRVRKQKDLASVRDADWFHQLLARYES